MKKTKAVHFVLQGKGGVGKSFVSALLIQYFESVRAGEVRCFDTDPVNQTLVSYKTLNAEHINLMQGSKIDERKFDQLMERLLSESGIFVVDNGAASFLPLFNYLIEHDALNMLREAGCDVFIHCVIAGGQSLLETLSGFKALAQHTDKKNIVIWLNEYFGAVEREGKPFKEMRVFTDYAEKVLGVVRIAKRNQDTFGKDIEAMTSSHLTFKEVLEGQEFTIMAKQRIKTVQRDIYTQLKDVGL